MRRLALPLLAFVLGGCLTASARLRAGPTLDTGGQPGYEINISAGLGIALSDEKGVRSMPGFGTSDRAGAALTETAELGSLDDELGWAAGLTGDLVTSTDQHALWLFGAALLPLIGDARRDPGHGKFSLGGTSRWALSAGFEGRAGIASDATGERQPRGIFAVLPAIDLTLVTTMDL